MTSRNVLVTGANRGIGLAIAHRFRGNGDQVVILTRAGDDVDGLRAVAGDVTDSDSVNVAFQAAEEICGGPMEVVVANAGVTDDGLLMRMSDDAFDRVVETNLTGAFRCARRDNRHDPTPRGADRLRLQRRRALRLARAVQLRRQQGGSDRPRPLHRPRAGGRGITANVVAPGFIETEMTSALPQERQDAYRAAIPAGRFARPEEVADAVSFLASPEAAYINGAVLPVDGGLGMGH